MPDWIGNGICESVCFTKNCKWDGGDCDKFVNITKDGKKLKSICNKKC